MFEFVSVLLISRHENKSNSYICLTPYWDRSSDLLYLEIPGTTGEYSKFDMAPTKLRQRGTFAFQPFFLLHVTQLFGC